MGKEMRKHSAYKQFIDEAKKRLATNDYSEASELNRIGIGNKAYIINSRLVCGEELYGYYKKVAELQYAGREYGALGRLIDEELYATLSEPERERYVLAISRLYRELKEEYLRQNQKALQN